MGSREYFVLLALGFCLGQRRQFFGSKPARPIRTVDQNCPPFGISHQNRLKSIGNFISEKHRQLDDTVSLNGSTKALRSTFGLSRSVFWVMTFIPIRAATPVDLNKVQKR